jgi:mRNA-degrading endonuclease RelE of RelBE toxin-antitoxin system
MSYEIVLCESLKKSVKYLKKRYPHVAEDVKGIARELQDNPTKGDVVPGSKGCRKVRVENTDLNRGKSGSYRLLYYVEDQPSKMIFLLLLYAKSDRGDVPTKEIIDLLNNAGLL